MVHSQTQQIVFTGSVLSGYFLSGVVYILLPIAAYLLMMHRKAARFYPVVTGVIVYFIAERFSALFASLFGASQGFMSKTVIAAEIICYLEETGRYFAMKYPVTDIKSTNAAVCYGIGHAGLECFIRAYQKFQIYSYGQRLNSKGLDSFISGKSAEKADSMTRQLQTYADHSLFLSIVDSLGSIVTFGVQISLSLLIFKKIHYEKRWLLLAILLHLFVNFAVWLASFTDDPLFTDFIGIIAGGAVIAIVFRIIGLHNCMNEIKNTSGKIR